MSATIQAVLLGALVPADVDGVRGKAFVLGQELALSPRQPRRDGTIPCPRRS